MAIITSRKSLKGIAVAHQKHTEDHDSICFTDMDQLIVLMQQHMGMPCKPLVKPGAQVKVGDKIGDAEEFFSVPIHAPCSGVVKRVQDFLTVTGSTVKAVVIQNDKQYHMADDLQPPVVNTPKKFLTAIRESGAVGLGGAGFPMHVKLAYKNPEKIHSLVINAAECEPYITADYRACLEDTDDILSGISAIKKFLSINQVYIGIEDNKPKALKRMDEKTEDDPHFHIVKLKSLYPQGAEKSLIYATTGITVQAGSLPADCGVVVMNVSSVAFIGKYLRTGIPLVSKRITVDGDCVQQPQNLIVPIGTPIIDILKFCQVQDHYKKILMGGPMMGLCVPSVETPIIKNNNAVLALSKNQVLSDETTECIRCGACTRSCPMNLMPLLLEKAYDYGQVDKLDSLGVSVCINCGCCSYICPAKRHLAQKHQLAKTFVRNYEKKQL